MRAKIVRGCIRFVAPVLLANAAAAQPLPDSPSQHLWQAARERAWRLHRPADPSLRAPVPQVLVLHGGFGSASQAESAYGWDALADREGFLVVYPDGIGRSWNAGGMCCGPALREAVADTGFLARLIEAAAQAQHIDRRRIYLTGMSNGAEMAYRYACEDPVPVAAICPVAGTFSQACPNPKPVSVFAIHGLADAHVPFAGGPGTKGVTQGNWLPVEQTLQAFRNADRCTRAQDRSQGAVRTRTEVCARGREVVLTTIAAAGHPWPGSAARTGPLARWLAADPASTALDATAVLWDFFRRHPAPP